ncbi:hypothetical protein HY642_01525 [Candidatus Woesearchaeota archaeon]|nr:hypothetical protein [Candidatus Woesearchaeota archaeon]
MQLFKKKEEPMAEPPPAYASPVDQVLQMQDQGFTNDQIVQALQRSGYDMATIMDAINQADAQRGVGQYPEQPMQQAQQPADVERIVESVVEEKWKQLQSDEQKQADWRDKVDGRLDKLEQSLSDVKADVENLHKAIISKIGEYDKNLLDVGTEIKAMEKVFQQVLPQLTENVQELGRITRQQKTVPAVRRPGP